uniref:Bax inhibitor 1 n=1 Tax=Araucaria cunninghamii TaxID=56994 RepID=A0A0D6QXY3_ARACU
MAYYGPYHESHGSGFPGQRSASSGWDYGALKNLRKISPQVQNHLKRVYLTLACAVIAAAVGIYLHLLWNVGGLLTGIASIALVAWLSSISPSPYNESKRVKLLMAAAACQGASIGPLVELVISIDPSILGTAFVGTGLAFGCFSGAAILARRREFLFIGGLLASGLSILLWLNFASAIFGGSTAVYMFEVYFGLLVFLGYIIFDTQMIIERADHGDYDYVKHSLELFTDLAAVFVRVVAIMARNSAAKSEKEKKKRRN